MPPKMLLERFGKDPRQNDGLENGISGPHHLDRHQVVTFGLTCAPGRPGTFRTGGARNAFQERSERNPGSVPESLRRSVVVWAAARQENPEGTAVTDECA